MKIAIVIPSVKGGGAERVVSQLANWWSEDRHEVLLITFSTAVDAYPVDGRVTRVSLDQETRATRAGRTAETLLKIRALRTRIGLFRPDVVVSFVEETNVFTLLACLDTGVPVIVANRDAPSDLPFRRDLAFLRRRLYPRARLLVTQTQRSADWYRREGFDVPTQVIPNPVDARVLAPAVASPPWAWAGEEKPVVILSVGRLSEKKDHALLLEAFRRVAPNHPAARLALVGEGPEGVALEQASEALGIRSKVSFFGWKPNVQDFFAHADIFAHPSRFEGFPNALIEAMAHGLPCVATDCRYGPREIVDHERNGLLVPVRDVAALASVLDAMLADPSRRKALGTNARKVRERFSSESVANMWRDALTLVAAGAQRKR